MSNLGATFSRNPYRDKQDDLVAKNLDLIAEHLRMTEVLRSQNLRIRALEAGHRPLTTRIAHKNGPVVDADKAA